MAVLKTVGSATRLKLWSRYWTLYTFQYSRWRCAQRITVHVVFNFRDSTNHHLAGFPTSTMCTRSSPATHIRGGRKEAKRTLPGWDGSVSACDIFTITAFAPADSNDCNFSVIWGPVESQVGPLPLFTLYFLQLLPIMDLSSAAQRRETCYIAFSF